MPTNSSERQVQRTKASRVWNGQTFCLVAWKKTTTSNLQDWAEYRNMMSTVIKSKRQYIIVWKDSWLALGS